MNTIPKMVIKSKSEADAYETLESRRLGDIYCSTSLQMDSLITYEELHHESFERAGITDRSLIERYINNRDEIPQKYVKSILKYERDIFLSNFEETNDYYRMLIGLPAMGSQFIYLDYNVMELYGFTETYEPEDYVHRTPLHLLPSNTLESMEVGGYLDELQTIYPNEKYISYLGKRRIDLSIARMSI